MRILATMLFIGWLFASVSVSGEEVEFRGLWVDAFHPGFNSSKEVSKLISDVRTAHGNAVVVEIRKRGDAYYNSDLEPRAVGVAPGYDPLSDLVLKAHDTNAGPRIEIHAWMVAYLAWRVEDGQPAQTNHPFRLHPDWFDQNVRGATTDGREYHFDPGHPEVQKHLFKVAMDIVSRYDVDGLSLDYLRYPGKDWGYNPVSVRRFNQRFGQTGQPLMSDTNWVQFRRDQVTDLLRKIYLSAIDIKPHLKISAATVAWPPVPKDAKDWVNRAGAYGHVFQDWRGWMEEGILDINMPMVYLDHQRPANKELFVKWVQFASDHRYNRHVIIAPAIYMNKISDSMAQIRLARGNRTEGKGTDGVCLYSYATFTKEAVSREAFVSALKKSQGSKDTEPPPFADSVPTPDMPWKSNPTTGHLKGFVYGGGKTNTLDGATVILKGTTNRKLRSDATGFYGAVDLPPGEYSLEVTFPGSKSATNTCAVRAGKVTTLDVVLSSGDSQ